MPLVSNVETAERSGAQYDPATLAPDLPEPSPYALPGLLLWLDAAEVVTLKPAVGGYYRWLDKSGHANHAAQADSARRTALGSAFTPRSVSFKD
jgi:hypothetical protein